MMLYVNGQDIATFVLGLVDEDIRLESFSLGPEKYLKTIDTFLGDKNLSLEAVEGIVLVTGPGSATALRASLSIANSLHYAKRIPLYSVEKDQEVIDKEFLTRELIDELQPLDTDAFASPVYANDPRITASNKDALGRKKLDS